MTHPASRQPSSAWRRRRAAQVADEMVALQKRLNEVTALLAQELARDTDQPTAVPEG